MNLPHRTSHHEHERFARAVEHDEGAREFPDELLLVRTLRRAGQDYRPGPAVRARIAENIKTRDTSPAARPTVRRARLAPALAMLAAVLLALGGVTLLLSKDALPGDPLYGLKRAGESTSLALIFDEREQASRQLEFAAVRLRELSLLRPASAADGDYRTALTGFTSQTAPAIAVLSDAATSSDGRALGDLRDWAGTQRAALAAARVPAGAAADREHAFALLDRVEQRAAALTGRLVCYRITSGQRDELGPLPATGTCQPAAVVPDEDRRAVAPPESPAPEPPAGPMASGTAKGPVLTSEPQPTPALPAPPAVPLPAVPGPSVPARGVPEVPRLPVSPLPAPAPQLPSLPPLLSVLPLPFPLPSLGFP